MSTSVIQAFKSLTVTGASNDHDHIFEVSYRYLANIKSFSDSRSFGQCLVALINLDKYHKALDLIKKVPHDLIVQFCIEVGYVYYKTNHSSELEELYSAVKTSSSDLVLKGFHHILAQNYYKNGHYAKALELYHDIISSNDNVDSEVDLAANELAVISQLPGSKAMSQVAGQNHDLLFNRALVALSQHQLAEALTLLEEANTVLLQQNYDQETTSIEKCSLYLVKAYIYHVQGAKKLSRQVLDELDVIRYHDPMLRLLLKNNLYALGDLLSHDNLNLVDRELDYQYNLAHLAAKLTKFQQVALIKNNLLLSYLTNTLSKNNRYLKASGVEEAVKAHDYSAASLRLLLKLGITNDELIEAAGATARKLYKYLNTSADFTEKVAGAFVLVAINRQQNKYDQSLIVLEKLVGESLDKNVLIPGLVGTLIKVYDTLDASDKSAKLYQQLVDKLTAIGVDDSNYNFAKIVAVKLLSLNDAHNAHKLFVLLKQHNPEDLLIKNFLGEPVDLAPVSALVSDVGDVLDVNIETLVPPQKAFSVKSTAHKVQKKKQRAAKFGPNKVLKPADNLTLDDERWLPMKLRSYYKPKKTNKKKTAHQGALESSPAPTPSPSPAPQAKPKKPKKKKGKK